MGNQLLRDGDAIRWPSGLELRLAGGCRHPRLAFSRRRKRPATGKALLRDGGNRNSGACCRMSASKDSLFPFQPWFDSLDPKRASNFLLATPARRRGPGHGTWARRWGLMVLNDLLHAPSGLILPNRLRWRNVFP